MLETGPHIDHKKHAPQTVRCMVVTVSDSRTPETDTTGQYLLDVLRQESHEVVRYEIVKDEPEQIRRVLQEGLADERVQVIITNGGTGISKRDGTYEVVERLLEKRLDGFGELFRVLSYQEIGAAAMLSRATAGLAQGTILIALPGSPNASKLAMPKLILPELGHMVREINR